MAIALLDQAIRERPAVTRGQPTPARSRRPWQKVLAGVALALVIAAACLLSAYWVFMVPMLEAPDESVHLDYALAIWANGGLLNGRDRPLTTYDRLVHPYSRYLHDRSGQQFIAGHPDVKVPRGYGTAAYFRQLAQDAPRNGVHGAPARNPLQLTQYPFGYYALLAAWIAGISAFGASLVQIFFGARLLSVVLLGLSLWLSYLILRELRVRRGLALVITAVMGFFPLTSFVSSYVQPDNLSLTMVSLCIYLALVYRRHPGPRLAIAFGLALAALFATKPQFYLCVIVAVVAMLITNRLLTLRPRGAALITWAALFLPTLAVALVHVWVVAGSAAPFGVSSSTGPAQINNHEFLYALHSQPTVLFGYIVNDLERAFASYYMSSTLSFQSFWGNFGWEDTPIGIGTAATTRWIGNLEGLLTLVIVFLTLFRMEQVVTRLIRAGRAGHRRWALRAAFSNPLLTSYFLFIIFMFAFFVYTDGTFAAQGRNWFPYLLAILLVSILYAPKALTHRRTQSVFSGAMLTLFILYAAIGSYSAIVSVQNRYYVGGQPVATALQPELGASQDHAGGHVLQLLVSNRPGPRS